MLKKQWIVALALGFSVSAQAADFTDADAKYALRDTSLAAAQEARAAYKAIIDQGVTGDELLRAGEGYLRATIYEGNHYYSISDDKERVTRKQIFNDCWKVGAETINPTKLGSASAAYYYFKASCVAYEAEVSTAIQRLALLPELNGALGKGLADEVNNGPYEGGGLYRVNAAVRGNPEAKGLPGGVYDPEAADKLIDKAIATPEGTLFCENYRRKVGILVELGKASDALKLANETVENFEAYLADSIIPETVRAETADCIKTVQAQADKLK